MKKNEPEDSPELKLAVKPKSRIIPGYEAMMVYISEANMLKLEAAAARRPLALYSAPLNKYLSTLINEAFQAILDAAE